VLNRLRTRPKTAAAILLLGTALRLVFILEFPVVQGDTEMYAEIARTWAQTGTYGMDEGDGPVPTYVRLPGYPAFLRVVFAFSGDTPGMRPVMYTQLVFDLLTCLIIGSIAREMFGERAAWTAFLLAAVCPFTANYVALPLTETLSIFATALAVQSAIVAIREEAVQRVGAWAGCGAAVAMAVLLRHDGVLLLGAMGLYLLFSLVRSADRGPIVGAGLIVAMVALLPLVPWTVRNQRVFHEFQPLTPRYANAPHEFVTHGYNRWVKTWIVDYVSVEDFFWKMPGDGQGEPVDGTRLPERAFDSPAQRAQTLALLADFNQRLRVDAELDARFAALAAERIRYAPLRYYVVLPLARMCDMWLRPRTEMLPIEVRWWEFEDMQESLIAVGFGGLNLLFVGAAAFAAWRHRAVAGMGLLVTVVLVRTLFLGTLENPEPRYTLECYPIILVLAGATIAGLGARFRPVAHAELRAEML
jgi:4-amino-4-deoxy-L-arabinose transferase-like glycosyltransferase